MIEYKDKSKNYNILFIISLVIILAIISIYEVGICNYNWLYSKINQIENIKFHISIFRIVCYLLVMIAYCIMGKRLNIEAIESIRNNSRKKILIIIYYILGMISIGVLLLLRERFGNLTTIFLILTILNFYLFVTYLSKSYVKNLILTGLTLGMMFSISVDFNHAIDEKKHFMSAFNLAMGNSDFINPITDNQLNDIPHLSDFTAFNQYYGIAYEKNITTEVNMDDVPSTPATYLPIMYFPSAIGIKLAILLKGSIADIYIAGRVFNLFTFIMLAICAIKILPYKKDIFQVIFMLPLIICIGATYSVDSTALGLVSIFIATCLRIYKEKKILNIKDVLILLGVFVLLCLAKTMAYVAVAIIFLILPVIKTLKENKKYLKYIIPVCFIAIIGLLLLVYYVKNTKIGDDPRGGETSVNGQLQFIMENPLKASKVGFNQIMNTLLSLPWLQQINTNVFFGKYGGQIFTIIMIFVIYISVTDSSYHFKIKDKILFLLGAFFSFAITSLVLYISFTPVGSENIAGYQARYVIPVLPLLLMCISSKKVEYTDLENRKLMINYFSGLMIMLSLIGGIMK